MEKRGILVFGVLFLFLVFTSLSVVADENETVGDLGFDEGQGYDWLIEQLEANNWGSDIGIISWAVLALYSSDYEEYQVGVDRLRSLESANNNWGDPFETSMAVLALNTVGEDVEDEVQWLVDQQQANFANGEWLIQFKPEEEDTQATCVIGYEGAEISFSMQGYNFTGIPQDCSLFRDSWIDFEICIRGDQTRIYESFSVDCHPPRVSASLLYYANDAFYIIDEDDSDEELEINNGCFLGSAGSCGCFYSQYGSWALEAAGDGSYSVPYLRANCNDDVQDNSFLYLLTGGNSYRDWLTTEGQSEDGSFGSGDIELTALAVIALGSGNYGSVSGAIDWLEFVQDGFTGSWEQDVGLTGMVLYALNRGGGTYIPTYDDDCGNGVIDDYEDCELNSDCNSSMICSNSCQCVFESSLCTSDDDCEQNHTCNFYTGECESSGAIGCNNNDDCNSGYFCNMVTNQCEAEEVIPFQEDECSTDADCPSGYECDFGTCYRKDGSSWITWVIAALVVLVVLGLGWFAYKKFFKGKKKKGGTASPVFVPKKPGNSGYPMTRSNVPARAPLRGTGRGEVKLEKDLDRALKKAKELVNSR
jgi:hypothetical protein